MTATALPSTRPTPGPAAPSLRDCRPASASLPWVAGLARRGDRPALVTVDGTTSYGELAHRVDDLAARLAGPRRLVLVEGAGTVETVVAHLASLAAGHVVLLAAAGDAAGRLREAYDPDIALDHTGRIDVARHESTHVLHPDLALLLSTSGSTGSAKLVRLSADNLAANAAQIAGFLDIREDDCAAMTLPLTYCYGLSVVHTHLAAGASLLLTDLSVVDECFWRLFAEAGATTFPGVPHTFELLGRSGFAERDLPGLRYVTQAGGRMDPERVRYWAGVGRERGWDLHVMYGQCEATARMAHLPPELALERPESVGVPVPGADVRVDDGEIVFRGPNVMLGYARSAADLALGRTVHELRTGDLGRIDDDGLLHVVGRRARFVKVLGHRVDLDAVEGRLRGAGDDVRCAGRDGALVVAAVGAESATARERLCRNVVRACGVPRDAVSVLAVDEHATLGSGKPDYPAVLALHDARTGGAAPDPGATTTVRDLYAHLLRRPEVADTDSFVDLGGDSLSFVEVSVRLEALLGTLPASWHVMPAADLDRLRTSGPGSDASIAGEASPTRRARPRWRSMESVVWVRALAIVLIVGTHADLFSLQGTANALLVVAGYQLVRFQLAVPSRRARAVRIARSAGRIAAPALLVIWVAHLAGGYYETRNLLLANWVFGRAELGPPWRFWFVEAIVAALLATAALLAVPAVHRLERRHPFGLPLALTVAAFVLFRLPVLPLPVPRMHGSALVVLHLFLLGWTVARARGIRQQRLVTALAVLMVGTFSFNPARDGLTLLLVLVLVWRPVTRVPAVLVPVVRVLAAASLFVYVIHWQALEVLWGHPVPAFAGSLALGVAYWWCWTRAEVLLQRLAARRRRLLVADASEPRRERAARP